MVTFIFPFRVLPFMPKAPVFVKRSPQRRITHAILVLYIKNNKLSLAKTQETCVKAANPVIYFPKILFYKPQSKSSGIIERNMKC